MDNPKDNWKNSIKDLRNNSQYNSSLSTYNKPITQNRKKTYLETSHKFERALINLREGLAELSQEYPDQDIYDSIPLKKIAYSATKHTHFRSKTPKRDLNLLRKNSNYLNNSNILNNSYLKTSDEYSIPDNKSRLHKRNLPSISTTRKSSKTGIFNDINNLEIVYNTINV